MKACALALILAIAIFALSACGSISMDGVFRGADRGSANEQLLGEPIEMRLGG
jgi:hypothetical protein